MTSLPPASSPRQPHYLRIRQYILDAIRDQHFVTGGRIPTEIELAQQFGVSRMTVNKAIRDLAEAGVLERFAGDGTYVAERKAESPLIDINNIADEIRQRGHQHQAEVLTLHSEQANEEIALRLGIQVGGAVFHSLIVHHENGVAIQLEERYVNPDWAPDYLEQDFLKITPNEYLMQVCPLTDIEHTVEAILPTAAVQQQLSIPQYEPCILVLRRTWSNKHLVSFARLTHPGSRYKLRSQTRVNQR